MSVACGIFNNSRNYGNSVIFFSVERYKFFKSFGFNKRCIAVKHNNVFFVFYKISRLHNCVSCAELFRLKSKFNIFSFKAFFNLFGFIANNNAYSFAACFNCFVNYTFNHCFSAYFMKNFRKFRLHSCSFSCGKYYSFKIIHNNSPV